MNLVDDGSESDSDATAVLDTDQRRSWAAKLKSWDNSAEEEGIFACARWYLGVFCVFLTNP